MFISSVTLYGSEFEDKRMIFSYCEKRALRVPAGSQDFQNDLIINRIKCFGQIQGNFRSIFY